MKKISWKKGTVLALAAVMTLALGACGGKDANKQLAKENVYSFQEIAQLDENDSIDNVVYKDGMLYLLATQYRYDEETGEYSVTFGYYKMGLDGSDQSFVKLEDPERQEDNSWFNATLLTEAGYVYAVENCSYQDDSDPDNYIWEDRYYLTCWNVDGELQWSERIDNVREDEYTYCNNLLDMRDGSAMAIMGGSRYETVQYAPDGREVARQDLDQELFERVVSTFVGQDGKLRMIFYEDDDWTKRYIASYDLETGELGEKSEVTFGENFSIYQGVNSDLLLTNNMGVYTWNMGDAEPAKLVDFVNSDLPTNNLRYIQMVDDQHFVAIYNDLDTYETQLAYFTYVDPKDIPDKEVLVLGGEYLGSNIKSRVIEFNKSSDQYRITMTDYSVYNTGDDWMAGQVRLNSDITSGRMPDIMLLEDMGNYGNYVAKGLLADVGKLLAGDEELGKLEYLQNVWDAYSVNGKLYAVVPSFSVRTMVAKKSLVGERTSWTMEDVNEVLAAMPEGATAYGDMTRSSYVYYMMSYAGQDFIDVESGKCNFDSQSFIDMLEFAKTLPKEYDEEYWEEYDYTTYQSQYRDNRSLMCELYMSDLRSCITTIKGQIGEDVAFVGFPTAESNGSVLNQGRYTFALSARSKHLDGAWQFVRQFLTPEYQNSEQIYDMPVLKSAFLDHTKEAMEQPYWEYEDGTKEYYDYTWEVNGESITLDLLTQEEVDEICEFIYTVDRIAYYNTSIRDIIEEEAEAFFVGQKSVQEVVDIIQSRAQVFVNENR